MMKFDLRGRKDLSSLLFLTSDRFVLEKSLHACWCIWGWTLDRWLPSSREVLRGKAFRNLDIEHLGIVSISLWDSMQDWVIITECTSCMTSYGIKSQSLERNVASNLSCSYHIFKISRKMFFKLYRNFSFYTNECLYSFSFPLSKAFGSNIFPCLNKFRFIFKYMFPMLLPALLILPNNFFSFRQLIIFIYGTVSMRKSSCIIRLLFCTYSQIYQYYLEAHMLKTLNSYKQVQHNLLTFFRHFINTVLIWNTYLHSIFKTNAAQNVMLLSK